VFPSDTYTHDPDKAVSLVAVIETNLASDSRDANAIMRDNAPAGDKKVSVFNFKVINDATGYLPNINNCDCGKLTMPFVA
jgi:hypothetical protein